MGMRLRYSWAVHTYRSRRCDVRPAGSNRCRCEWLLFCQYGIRANALSSVVEILSLVRHKYTMHTVAGTSLILMGYIWLCAYHCISYSHLTLTSLSFSVHRHFSLARSCLRKLWVTNSRQHNVGCMRCRTGQLFYPLVGTRWDDTLPDGKTWVKHYAGSL